MLWQPVEPETYVSKLSAPLPRPEVVFSTPGYNQPKPEKNSLATAAVVLGVIGLPVPILALAAVICGHIAAANGARVGLHLARGGYVLGYTSLWVWGLLLLSMIFISS